MKKYYLCQYSAEEDEIGTFPQCWNFEKNISPLEKKKFYTIYELYLNKDINQLKTYNVLYGLTIGGRAKRTNVLSSVASNAPLVEKKVLELLREYNLGDYHLIEIKLSKKGNNYDYYYFYCLNFMTDYVDFPNSEIGFLRSTEEGGNKLFQFENLASVKELKKGYIALCLDPIKIKLTNDFPKSIEVFKLDDIMGNDDLFLSEDLCKEIEKQKITGWTINYHCVAIAE